MSDEAKEKALRDACEWALAWMCNPNVIDGHQLCAKLIDALVMAGMDKAELDKAAMAAFGGKPWRPSAEIAGLRAENERLRQVLELSRVDVSCIRDKVTEAVLHDACLCIIKNITNVLALRGSNREDGT